MTQVRSQKGKKIASVKNPLIVFFIIYITYWKYDRLYTIPALHFRFGNYGLYTITTKARNIRKMCTSLSASYPIPSSIYCKTLQFHYTTMILIFRTDMIWWMVNQVD